MIVYEGRPPVWRLFLIWNGSILPKVWKRVVYIDLLAIVVCVLFLHFHWHFINLTVAPFTIIGLVLGLFVGFRNTACYERFWEARTLWGSCLITCRNLTREALVFSGSSTHEETRQRVYLLIAFAHALRHRLRGSDPAEDIQKWLPETVSRDVLSAPSVPNRLLTLIGETFYRLHKEQGLESPLMAQTERNIDELSHILGGCERILSTPLPYAYTLLLHRSLYVYCWLLPFGLVNSIGYMTPVVVSFMAYAFLGLDALGEEIADPFSSEPNALALDSICRTIENNLLAELGEPYPPLLKPVNSLLM